MTQLSDLLTGERKAVGIENRILRQRTALEEFYRAHAISTPASWEVRGQSPVLQLKP